jgi:hypothetical protein
MCQRSLVGRSPVVDTLLGRVGRRVGTPARVRVLSYNPCLRLSNATFKS